MTVRLDGSVTIEWLYVKMPTHHMRVQLLVAHPVGNLGKLLPVDAPALGVEVEHGALQVSPAKQDVVEVLEGVE